jgi:hypothetical protein
MCPNSTPHAGHGEGGQDAPGPEGGDEGGDNDDDDDEGAENVGYCVPAALLAHVVQAAVRAAAQQAAVQVWPCFSANLIYPSLAPGTTYTRCVARVMPVGVDYKWLPILYMLLTSEACPSPTPTVISLEVRST